GQTSLGTITANTSGGFDVTGAHAYREEGTPQLTLLIVDPSGTGALLSATVSVTAPTTTAATRFSISAPANATAGTAFNVTVTAQDLNFNTATGYTGTIHFTSSDSQASLPGDYTFTPTDNGTHTFSLILKSAGSQTFTAT